MKKADIVWISELKDIYGLLSENDSKNILETEKDRVKVVETEDDLLFFCETDCRHITIKVKPGAKIEFIDFFRKYVPLANALSILRKLVR